MNLLTDLRPTTADAYLTHNPQVLRLLSGMLAGADFPPLLFVGPSGAGKTTLAYLLAGDNREVVDAATARGIDEVRELRERLKYKPVGMDSYTIIVDECHRLTKDAQNALLEIVEHPPAWLRFIFCTTDPKDLIKTLKGRLMQVEFTGMEPTQQVKLVGEVLKALNTKADPKVFVAEFREIGIVTPRDTINATQVKVAGGRVTGSADLPEIFAAVQALFAGKFQDCLKILHGAGNTGCTNFRYVAASYAKAILLQRADRLSHVAASELTKPMPSEEVLMAAAVVVAIYNIRTQMQGKS